MATPATKPLPFGSNDEFLALADRFPTPFHIYDEEAIRAGCRRMKEAFAWVPNFMNYFAVKATPNPHILRILKDEGFGMDCSSLPELLLAEAVGCKGESIMFTSNNTPEEEFRKAKSLGAVINLDDVSHLDFLHQKAGLPSILSFRYNPGPSRQGTAIIGHPEESKFGVTRPQLIEAYGKAKSLGVKRFALHTMVVSNCRNVSELVETGRMMFEIAQDLKTQLDISLEFINLGGGFGIPYRPEDEALDITAVSRGIEAAYRKAFDDVNGPQIRVVFECGRFVTGPHGVLVTRVIHHKDIYKKYIGVDACMAHLMRPGMYGAYHHLTAIPNTNNASREPLFGQMEGEVKRYDVVGGLCENNDKLAVDRDLPPVAEGDVIVIHDAGAHGHSMGFNYNGKLRSAEYLRKADGSVVEIRRKEELADYFSTIDGCFNLPGRRCWERPCFRGAVALVVGAAAGALAMTLLKTRCQK